MADELIQAPRRQEAKVPLDPDRLRSVELAWRQWLAGDRGVSNLIDALSLAFDGVPFGESAGATGAKR